MKSPRPSGKLQALGAATAQATVQAAGLVKAINPQRAFEAVRKFKAARQQRSDVRSGVDLRRAQAADLAGLLALHHACGLAGALPALDAPDGAEWGRLGTERRVEGGAPGEPALHRAWLALNAAGAQVWLAEKDGELLGALTLYLLPLLAHGGSSAGWVDDLAVHQTAHHLSIPRRLIAQATEVAIAAGAHKLALAPRRKPARERGSREPARGFVETLDYSRHGRSADLPTAPEGAT